MSLAHSKQPGMKRIPFKKEKKEKGQNWLRHLGYWNTTFVGKLPIVSLSLDSSLRDDSGHVHPGRCSVRSVETGMSHIPSAASLFPSSNMNFQGIKH